MLAIAPFDSSRSQWCFIQHTMLLSHLERCLGLKGFALEWFKLYLLDCLCSVGAVSVIGGPSDMRHPPGDLKGPLPVSLDVLPLGVIFRRYRSFPMLCGQCAGALSSKGSFQVLTL